MLDMPDYGRPLRDRSRLSTREKVLLGITAFSVTVMTIASAISYKLFTERVGRATQLSLPACIELLDDTTLGMFRGAEEVFRLDKYGFPLRAELSGGKDKVHAHFGIQEGDIEGKTKYCLVDISRPLSDSLQPNSQ